MRQLVIKMEVIKTVLYVKVVFMITLIVDQLVGLEIVQIVLLMGVISMAEE